MVVHLLKSRELSSLETSHLKKLKQQLRDKNLPTHFERLKNLSKSKKKTPFNRWMYDYLLAKTNRQNHLQHHFRMIAERSLIIPCKGKPYVD